MHYPGQAVIQSSKRRSAEKITQLLENIEIQNSRIYKTKNVIFAIKHKSGLKCDFVKSFTIFCLLPNYLDIFKTFKNLFNLKKSIK